MLLAGGLGTRLGPLSTPERPKQVRPLLPDGRSPLRATWERICTRFGKDQVLVVTGRTMHAAVRATLAELPDRAFLVEPAPRNTLPALVWATAEAERRGAAGIVSVHADHWVDSDAAYMEAVTACVAAADEAVALVGLQPSRADTGLGWILRGAPCSDGDWWVDRFVEKPTRAVCERLMADGGLWNLGCFSWTVQGFAEGLHAHRPSLAMGFDRLRAGTPVGVERSGSGKRGQGLRGASGARRRGRGPVRLVGPGHDRGRSATARSGMRGSGLRWPRKGLVETAVDEKEGSMRPVPDAG